MSNDIVRYERLLKRELHCSRKVKERLIAKFNSMLSVFQEDNPAPSMEKLCEAFGSPEELARVLSVEIDEKEEKQYRCNQKIKRFAIVLLMTIFVLITAYVYFLKEIPSYYVEEVGDIPGISTTETVSDYPE